MTHDALSVIVPTNRTQDVLERCLDSLAAQTSPPDEIVVVDDNPRTRLLAPNHPVPVSIIRSHGGGASAARNLGVQAAQGNLVLFLDDDMIADPALVERHRSAHSTPTPAAVVGRCHPAPLTDNLVSRGATVWYFRLYERMEQEPPTFVFFCTGQLSLPKARLVEVGGFDTTLPCSREDWELGIRWLRAGYAIRYEPEALGRHEFTLTTGERLRRAELEGHADTILVARYPKIRAALHLATNWPAPSRSLAQRTAFRLLRVPTIRRAGMMTLDALERADRQTPWGRLFSVMHLAAYDRGSDRAVAEHMASQA